MENSRVENVEADVAVTCSQGALRPLALELAERVLALGDSQATPLHFGYADTCAVFMDPQEPALPRPHDPDAQGAFQLGAPTASVSLRCN